MDKEIAKIGDYWSDQTLDKRPPKIAWWDSYNHSTHKSISLW
jgi:hypothetical protein